MANSDNKDSEKKTGESRAQILASVKTPLLFFALALLVIEASLAIVISVGKLETNQAFWSVAIMAALFFIVVIVVTILAYNRPENLMAEATKVAQTAAEKVSKTVATKVVLLQNLRKLRYDLGTFDKQAPVDTMQQNKRHPGTSQNLFSTYVEPAIVGILENPQLLTSIDQETLEKLEKLRTPDYSVGEFLTELDKIIQGFH